MKHLWIIYDDRATPWSIVKKDTEAKKIIQERNKLFGDGEKFMKMFVPGNTDDASVLVSCDSLQEARSYEGEFRGCIYMYDVKGKELVNERFIEILR